MSQTKVTIMANKPSSTEPSLNLRIIDAVAFQLFLAIPVPESAPRADPRAEWRSALPTLRSQYRNEAVELIGRLNEYGIEIRTAGKKGEETLAQFITDLMTHPARSAYDESEVAGCLNN